jgi:hypothetical protein
VTSRPARLAALELLRELLPDHALIAILYDVNKSKYGRGFGCSDGRSREDRPSCSSSK